MSNVSEATLGERLNRKLHQLFIALILLWAVLGSFRPVMDNVDLGWHVAQGRWMVQHASFYRQDLLNYPNLYHSIVHEYPLFQVILYFFWSLGWWGPCVLTALAYAGLVGVILRAAHQLDLGTSSLPPIAIGLMVLYLQLAFPLRPHLATYLGVTILGIFLLRHRGETNWTTFWPMALLQIAWTNCHSGFVLGPAMIALFGAEIILRDTLRERVIPWVALRMWLGAFLLILLACFVNPHGWARFGPPFYQDSLESIRAYVGEMEPLNGPGTTLYNSITVVAALVVVTAIFFRRGAVAFSFLIFAFFFYHQALEIKKAWPIFGLFIPLLILSTGAFSSSFALRKSLAWPSVLGHGVISVLFVAVIFSELTPSSPNSLASMWREYDHGRTELSTEAVQWLKTNKIEGRLFHRCEDGGLLQMEGYVTFADTGFGKFDEAFIHEIGIVNERPAQIPLYLSAYKANYVICSTFCYQWPYYLKERGCHLIFYSPNSSVWTVFGTGFPSVSDHEIKTTFDHDIEANGIPTDTRLFGRNLMALNSLGLEDFAFEKLTSLPKDFHHAPWYWEAARFMCVDTPPFSAAHRAQLLDEANQLHDDSLTAEFRAYAANANGNTDGALKILESIPPARLSNYTAELLLKIYVARKDPPALALAQRTDCFDLRNGHHWQLLAQAEDQAGHTAAAGNAWLKAVFYAPDDMAIFGGATDFATKNHDTALSQAIEASSHAYSRPVLNLPEINF